MGSIVCHVPFWKIIGSLLTALSVGYLVVGEIRYAHQCRRAYVQAGMRSMKVMTDAEFDRINEMS